MKLLYSHSFDHTPRVLIVPNPDSYDSVKKHIAPVQEGISLLTAMLEREYSYGDWNMEFEVVTPGDRASFEPDIIVNLDSRQDDDGCGEDYAGWAIPSVKKPVQTVVFSLGFADMNIRSTTMHEIIHAMGVGH
ncbi:MAG: hypothetical protein F4Y51_01565, partial [Cenarchaeum sp. SB0664_bin_35]|nr:hypothetical protein [Cenarchaeum sp. SB0664_bin_35]